MTAQPKQLLRDAHLSARYNRSPRTITRWKRAKILPPADMTINGSDYWHPETIETNERERLLTRAGRTDIVRPTDIPQTVIDALVSSLGISEDRAADLIVSLGDEVRRASAKPPPRKKAASA